MRLLLDTNALIWLIGGDPQLGQLSREAISTATSVVVADASLWEIAIKTSIGKLRTDPDVAVAVRKMGFERLTFTDRHFETLSALPLHHRDPFDRVLISQALSDDLAVATSDPIFSKYGVRTIDART